MNCTACHTQMIRMVDLKQSHIWYETCSICNGVFLMQESLATLKSILFLIFSRA